MRQLEYLIRELIGCTWGRKVWDSEDTPPCLERAVRIIVLHNQDEERSFKLCEEHAQLVESLTNPHEEK